MRSKINRYIVFYTFFVYFLVIILLPIKYNGIPFGAHPIIALSIYGLIILLPISLLLIVASDIIDKRYKILAKNVVIVFLLFLLALGIKKYFLDPYVYAKSETSKETEAARPRETQN